MTKKQELLLELDIIKNEHLKWVNYAEAKFKGLDVDEKLAPVKHTECVCGKMILEYGQVIYLFKTAHSLADDHREFHRLSEKLYDLMNSKDEGGLFTKNKNRIIKKEKMETYADSLRKMSDNLIRSFENIKNEISCIDDKKIESMLSNPE